MKSQYSNFLSMLFLCTACSSGASSVIVEPAASTPLVAEPGLVKTAEPAVRAKNEVALLDFTISPDGKKLAVYLNTGVYLYDVETSKRTAFYEFESDEYYSELNTGATIYPPLGAPGALAFSRDGSEIAISGKFKDEYIAVWNLSTHEIVDYIANYPNGNYVRELAFHPNGETILIRSTYLLSQLHCVETGGSEDTLTLVALDTKNNLFETKVCNTYSGIETFFSENNKMSLYYYGESPFHQVRIIDAQTGNIIQENELDSRADGLAYDLSPNGRVVAVSDIVDDGLKTTLVNTTTGENLLSLMGMIDFLDNENRYLVYFQDQLQLQESNKSICVFNGLEYYKPYARVSGDNRTIASLTFKSREFQNSIQIWSIPNCKLINTIPFD
jgi:WD40 repeat protein